MASPETNRQQNPDARKARIWQVVSFVLSILFSGAAGAYINHYYSTLRTVVTYSINTTSLGAGEVTKSVLPTLKLQLDNTEIPAVYTHTIELSHSSGPELDQVSVGITVSGAKLYGNPVATGPDALHQITCKYDPTVHTIVCSIGRISAKSNPYRIVFATDQASQINMAVDGKNTEIQLAQPTQQNADLYQALIAGMLTVAVIMVMILILQFYLKFRRRRTWYE
jgi:hypothetical protein